VNGTHDPRHEEILAELAAGERDAADAEAARLLRECVTCREALAALRETVGHVERAGEAQRATVAESRGVASAPGLERVAPALERLASEGRAAPRPRRTLWLAVAAALFLVIGPLVAYRLWGGGREPAAPVTLGTDDLQLVEPVGEVHEYGPFVWEYSGAANGFDLIVFDEDAGPDAKPVLVVRCKEPSWVPDAETRAKLPPRIRWQVDVLDADNVPFDSRHASARRSSR